MCHGQKKRYIGDGRPPTFNRNPYNGLMTIPYYMEIQSNGSLEPGTYITGYWQLVIAYVPEATGGFDHTENFTTGRIHPSKTSLSNG